MEILYKKIAKNPLTIKGIFSYLSYLLATLHDQPITYTSNNKRVGSSNNCFTRTKNDTDSLPSMMRWS
jgi:hypothetical protein